MQGMGFAKLAIISGILELCARLLTAYVLVPMFGFTGVCFGSPAAWIFASCFVVPGAYICLGRLKKKIAAEAAQ
jgi:O-antigen/teichoic acid export membrane protein